MDFSFVRLKQIVFIGFLRSLLHDRRVCRWICPVGAKWLSCLAFLLSLSTDFFTSVSPHLHWPKTRVCMSTYDCLSSPICRDYSKPWRTATHYLVQNAFLVYHYIWKILDRPRRILISLKPRSRKTLKISFSQMKWDAVSYRAYDWTG